MSHQYLKNINHSGYEVEAHIRELIGSVLPDRFKVTHEYIISAPNAQDEPSVSPQVDVMIVDTMVPHLIFALDGANKIEVVPVEAVVGIFEIKRTLNKASLVEAVQHLKNIVASVNVTKTNATRYLPGGFEISNSLTGGHYNNPISGILAVNYDIDLRDSKKSAYIKNIIEESSCFDLIDIIGSFDGLFCCVTGGHPNIIPRHIPSERKMSNTRTALW